MDIEGQKKAAAEKAASLVEHGMRVGLGTGSTVAYLLPALAARRLDIQCVATSARTESDGRALGLPIAPFTQLDRLDVAIDGADQAARDGWLVKGGGGAHVREKIVAAAADRFIVIVSADKLVDRVSAPIPVELLAFGLASVLRSHPGLKVREGTPASPDGGVIADWLDPFEDPESLSTVLAGIPGLVGHGLFPPPLVSELIVGE